MTVSITKVEPETKKHDTKKQVYKSVKKAMMQAGWKKHIHKGEDTLLKVNMCWADFLLPGMCTSPWVLGAVIDTIQDHVGKIYAGEGLAAAFQSWKTGCRINKWDRVAKEYNVDLIDLSKKEFTHVKMKNVPFKVTLSKFAKDIPNLITLPLMKTHSVTTFTGSLKNQFGITFGKRITYHLHLDDVIAGINASVKPNFAVMDATIAMEGNGPANGKSKIMDLILASDNLVGIDSTACRIMKINPKEIGYIKAAQKLDIGKMNPKIIGPKPKELATDFEPAMPQGYYEKGMLPLLKSPLKNIVYNYFWNPGRLGVKILRDYWYLKEGRIYKENILKNSRYGTQWI